jgi:hypothetical protein
VAGASQAPVFDSSDVAARTLRTPKTADLVAARLRRMIIDGEFETGHPAGFATSSVAERDSHRRDRGA